MAVLTIFTSAYKGIEGYEDYYVGKRLNVPHYSQPTEVTCGATVLAMIKSFEELKDSGTLPSQPDILDIYDNGNTDGADGLSTPELKALITEYGFYKSIYSDSTNFAEVGADEIETAIEDTYNYVYSPTIIYGNTYWGSAGGHYYTSTGEIYCDDILVKYNICSYRGLYINDSVYNSPAYPNLSKSALVPSVFITADEMENYWKPTGSALPWLRKHYYIRQG
jgi:hypothetical protein